VAGREESRQKYVPNPHIFSSQKTSSHGVFPSPPPFPPQPGGNSRHKSKKGIPKGSWDPEIMKGCLRAILDDPMHRIRTGEKYQHTVGNLGAERVFIPRTTIKRMFYTHLSPLIKSRRGGVGGDDISNAAAYLETMDCKPYGKCGLHLRHFHGIEESVMEQHCLLAYNSGFPLDQASLLGLARALHDNKNVVIGVDWIEGFLDRHPSLRRLKARAIDWQRVDAANKDNIKIYLERFKEFLRRAKAEGAFEGEYWDDKQCFNYDEVASDPSKGRNSKAAMVFGGLVDDNISDQRAESSPRVSRKRKLPTAWDVAPSDHGFPFHVTVGITTRGDGTYMPPYLIHSNNGVEVKNNDYVISRKLLDNLSVPNIRVRRTANGSMHRWLFID
jgi:hypothetical protein